MSEEKIALSSSLLAKFPVITAGGRRQALVVGDPLDLILYDVDETDVDAVKAILDSPIVDEPGKTITARTFLGFLYNDVEQKFDEHAEGALLPFGNTMQSVHQAVREKGLASKWTVANIVIEGASQDYLKKDPETKELMYKTMGIATKDEKGVELESFPMVVGKKKVFDATNKEEMRMVKRIIVEEASA
jgi:hypothetical protein